MSTPLIWKSLSLYSKCFQRFVWNNPVHWDQNRRKWCHHRTGSPSLLVFYIIMLLFIIPSGLLCNVYILLRQNFKRDYNLKFIHVALCACFFAAHAFHAVTMVLVWCPFGDSLAKSYNELVQLEVKLRMRKF